MCVCVVWCVCVCVCVKAEARHRVIYGRIIHAHVMVIEDFDYIQDYKHWEGCIR
jgi:hypothetical protein